MLLAALVSYAVYSVSYSKRRLAYDQQALSGAMGLVTDSLLQQPEQTRERYMNIVARLFGADLSLLGEDEIQGLPTDVSKLMSRSKPAFLRGADQSLGWLLPLNASAGYKLSIQSLSEQQFRAHTLLFVSELSRREGARNLDDLAEYSPYPLRFSELRTAPLDSQQLARLRRDSVVVAYAEDAFQVYAPWQDERLVVLGPIPVFNDLPLPVALSMMGLSMLIIVLMSYLLVFQFDRRLASIRSMVNRFGSGELQARVMLDGNEPIAELGGKINAMAERIEGLLDSQRSIMQAVSHELRTPLARIRFRLEMLEPASDDASEPAKTAGIRQDLDQLEQLIDEVLEHHKLTQAPDLPFGSVQPGELLEEAYQNLHELYPAVNIQISVATDEGIQAHQPSVYRLIQNLISNACKHARSQVLVSAQMRENGYCLRVEDDGSGIPEEERARVFNAFYRVESSRNKKTGGYGLGLAIVQRIAALHRAQLSLDGSALGGACFQVIFPCPEPQVTPKTRVNSR